MRSVLHLLLATVAGVFLGLGSAYLALEAEWGFNRQVHGPWSGNPRAGGVAAEPYTRAALVRSGELVLGGGEGVTFTATADQDGRALTGTCVYTIAGPPPPARYFTLTAYTPEGRLIDNPARRFGFTSLELVRGDGGAWQVTASRTARPGHWLPVDTGGSFVLVLRLYDTALASGTGFSAPVMPEIRREACS